MEILFNIENKNAKPITTELINKLIKPESILIAGLALLFIFGVVVIEEAYGFIQNVKIHVDKGDYDLGRYAVTIKNIDTDQIKTEYHRDSTSASQKLVVEETITANTGDRLLACIVGITYESIHCDYRDAYRTSGNVHFFVYMDKAR